jgi:hypothetical protein
MKVPSKHGILRQLRISNLLVSDTVVTLALNILAPHEDMSGESGGRVGSDEIGGKLRVPAVSIRH